MKYEQIPNISKEDISSIVSVLKSKKISIYKSTVVIDFENSLKTVIGSKYVHATNNGSSAEQSLLCSLDINPGSDILIQSLNYVSVPMIVKERGFNPVFFDIDLEILNFDINSIKKQITKNTKAIIISTIFGITPDLTELKAFLKNRGVYLIEDLSQALGVRDQMELYKIQGDAAFASFSDTKNITTCEGGAVFTNNKEVSLRVRKTLNLGQEYKESTEPAYPSMNFEKDIDHTDIGYTFRMSPVLAALGISQIKLLDKIFEKRNSVVEVYINQLSQFKNIEIPINKTRFNFCYNALPIMLSIETSTICKITHKCLSAGLDIRPTYFSEIIDYKVFRTSIKGDLKNFNYFKEHNLILPIPTHLTKSNVNKALGRFIKILKEEGVC